MNEPESKVVVNFQAPKSLREEANKAALKLDTDLSKELRRAMRDLIAKAEKLERVA
jgi:hypothetical protein